MVVATPGLLICSISWPERRDTWFHCERETLDLHQHMHYCRSFAVAPLPKDNFQRDGVISLGFRYWLGYHLDYSGWHQFEVRIREPDKSLETFIESQSFGDCKDVRHNVCIFSVDEVVDGLYHFTNHIFQHLSRLLCQTVLSYRSRTFVRNLFLFATFIYRKLRWSALYSSKWYVYPFS